jgi:cold shock protein
VSTGIVKFYDPNKGFGFIKPDDPSLKDAFVHASTLARCGLLALNAADKVEYQVSVSEKTGREAVSQIRLLSR